MEEMTAQMKLPLLVPGQGQKEVTHNEALITLEWFAMPVVESRTAIPAENAASGTAWLIPDDAEGAWAAHAGRVALRWEDDWRFIIPPKGLNIYVTDEDIRLLRISDIEWREEYVPTGRQLVPEAPTGGGVVDVEARETLANLIAALHSMGLLQVA